MCRYAVGREYLTSWVCIGCRHVAQFPPYTAPRCPTCRGCLQHVGRDFHAPRKRDDSGWFAVAFVLGLGMNYDSCGCIGPGARPRTKAEARRFTA